MIFFERGDAEAKGVRDQLLEPNLLLMLLLLAEVLCPINILSKYLQTSTLVYALITAVSFLHISGQRNHLGHELRGCDKASQHEPSALIKKLLAEIGYSFVDDLISEIKEALVVDNPILEAFNIFSIETQSEEYSREHMHILCNHYGDQINDIYQGDSTPAEAIISTLEQEVEFLDFFCTFDEVVKELNDQAKKQAQQKVLKGEIKQKDIPEYLNTIKPTLSDVYSKMCSEGSFHNFPIDLCVFV